jgi:hypothetical protein
MIAFILSLFDSLILVKVAFMVLTIMIFIFVLFIFKQVLNMNSVVDYGSSSAMVKTVAIVNIIVAFCLILTALVIL